MNRTIKTNVKVNANVKGENNMNKTINITLPTMNNGDQLILTFVDGVPCFKDMSGNAVNINVFNTVNVNIEDEIKEKGYVFDKHENRRWTMAQMFNAMNYEGVYRCRRESGFNAFYMHKKPYHYQWDTTIQILKDIAKFNKKGRTDELWVEKHFFSRQVVNAMLSEYMELLTNKTMASLGKAWVCRREDAINWSTGEKIKVNRLHSYTVSELTSEIAELGIYLSDTFMETDDEKYAEKVDMFINEMCPEFMLFVPEEKSKIWLDAFKGRGAYWTMKNMFTGGWNCFVTNGASTYRNEKAVAHMDDYLEHLPIGEKYKLMGMLKQVIKENDFDFRAKMRERK